MEREDFEEYEDYIERLKQAVRQREAQLSALQQHVRNQGNLLRRVESENAVLRSALAKEQDKLNKAVRILVSE